jgi:hypothetical protein
MLISLSSCPQKQDHFGLLLLGLSLRAAEGVVQHATLGVCSSSLVVGPLDKAQKPPNRREIQN